MHTSLSGSSVSVSKESDNPLWASFDNPLFAGALVFTKLSRIQTVYTEASLFMAESAAVSKCSLGVQVWSMERRVEAPRDA